MLEKKNKINVQATDYNILVDNNIIMFVTIEYYYAYLPTSLCACIIHCVYALRVDYYYTVYTVYTVV